MNCAEVRPLLDACLDGELDLVHSVTIEQHLASCESCRAVGARNAAMTALLRARVSRPSAPEALHRRVRLTIRELVNADARASVVAFSPPAPARWLPLAAAIAVLIGLGLAFVPPGGGGGGLPAFLADALNSHVRASLVGPLVAVESSDRHTVKPWLASRLDFSPPVVDLASAGFPLSGARLDFVGQRTVAALVYLRRLHRIDVFISPGDGETESAWAARDGFRLVHWRHAGMRTVVISDLAEPELRDFATRLRDAAD